jgi:hypothetical protein
MVSACPATSSCTGPPSRSCTGLAAAIAQRMAINPLLGAAAGALLLGAMVKTIADAKKTNEEVKDLKLNLDAIGDGVKYPTAGLGKLEEKLIEVLENPKNWIAS